MSGSHPLLYHRYGVEWCRSRMNREAARNMSPAEWFLAWRPERKKNSNAEPSGRSPWGADAALIHQTPLNFGARFSRKALVPSFLSAVEKQRPKSAASWASPSASVMSDPWLTALRQ